MSNTSCYQPEPTQSRKSSNMRGGEGDDELHIAMFPWLAFGHFHPFLHLSKSLITSTARCRRIKVSFLSTPRNLARLPPIPPHLSSLLHLVPLPMPTTVDGLPPAAEATVCWNWNRRLQKTKETGKWRQRPGENPAPAPGRQETPARALASGNSFLL